MAPRMTVPMLTSIDVRPLVPLSKAILLISAESRPRLYVEK